MTISKAEDPVWMLYVAHFEPCTIIFEHHRKTRILFEDPRTQEQAAHCFIAYTHLWMALLYVVAEGFKTLKLSDPKITPLIDQYLDDLRKFRNSVFHFQTDDHKRAQFHDVEKFNWAGRMHVAFQNYFARRWPS